MKSTSILFFMIFLLLLSCSEAPIIEATPTGRIVLAEIFTYARCSYCPYAEHALDSLSNEYGDSLAIIAYHRRIAGDTISPEYVSTRENFYGVTASPATVFDGASGIVQAEDPAQDYQLFKGWIISERNNPPKLRLHLETDLVSSTVNLKLHIIVIDSLADGDYRLFYVLYEDSVYFAQTGAAESTFYFVVRKMMPDEQGASLNLSYPDSIIKEVYFNIQSNWNIEKLGIVGFVQNMETKQILQAIVDKRLVID